MSPLTNHTHIHTLEYIVDIGDITNIWEVALANNMLCLANNNNNNSLPFGSTRLSQPQVGWHTDTAWAHTGTEPTICIHAWIFVLGRRSLFAHNNAWATKSLSLAWLVIAGFWALLHMAYSPAIYTHTGTHLAFSRLSQKTITMLHMPQPATLSQPSSCTVKMSWTVKVPVLFPG